MKKILFVVMMMVALATSVFAADKTMKTAFVKNSTGKTIALVEQNDDNSYDWSTIVVVLNDCIAIKQTEKTICILFDFDIPTGACKGGVWKDYNNAVLCEVIFGNKRPKTLPLKIKEK